MEKLHLNDLVMEKRSEIEDISIDFARSYFNYERSYLCDLIIEHVDSYIDIHYSDLEKWSIDNISFIEESTICFGVPTNENGMLDFYKLIQQGQIYAFEQDIYNDLDDITILIALYKLYYIYDYEMIPKKEYETLNERLENEVNINSCVSLIDDIINEVFLNYDEEREDK